MRLIDADALKRWLETNKANVNPLDYNTKATYAECITMVENMETIEAEPVRHGKWLMITDSKHCGVCSVCFRQDYIDPLATHCRYCGAKMDLEGK